MDTTGGKGHTLSPVFIEAERIGRLKRWVVDSSKWPAVGTHLSHLLNQIEGVYLRDYGGQGGLKTLSIRGMGAPLTGVTFQGLPARAPTLGLVNLAPFFLPALREISFTPGSDLSLSPGAVGILSLFWRPRHKQKLLGWRTAQYGEALIYGVLESPAWLMQASALTAMNKYPFTEPEKGLRENADYRYIQGTWAHRRKSFQLTGWGYGSWQFIPPPVLVGAAVGPSERLQQHLLTHTAELKTPLGDLRVQHMAERVNHTDRFSQVSWSHLHTIHGQLKQTWQHKHLLYGLTLYGAADWVRSNRMARGFRPISQISQYEGALTGFLAWHKGAFFLRGEGRLTALSRFRPQISLLMRMGWQGLGIELLRGVRFPSLWERFWIGYGNPTLLPEQSLQAQVFMEKLIAAWRVYAAAFLAQTQNRIVTIPLSPVRWQTYSLGYIQSIGGEGRIEYHIQCLSLWLGGTVLSPREYSFSRGEILPYTPPYSFIWGGIYTKARWRLLYQATYTSWRTSSLALSQYTILNPYVLHSLAWAYTGIGWKVELGAENILNVPYEIIRGYPMPPRQLYLHWSMTLEAKDSPAKE